MSREVVLDIETIGDIRDFDNLKVTVVSIYEYENNKYQSFLENELGQLWPILEKAERIIGYNSEHFDLPILDKYYAGDLMKFPHLDLLKVVRESTGSRFKLNDLVKATLQMEKSADGLQAQTWWQEGKIDEIKKYCEQDVKVTMELYEYGRKNKMLYYNTLTGDLTPFPVNFDPPAKPVNASGENTSNINLTLPL
ncbi:MAG: ribonuclease H-like domain-containing protein [Candidatus Magasanikiibacteriota bacterium]